MSPAIFIRTPPTFKHHCITRFQTSFCTLKESALVCRKSVRFRLAAVSKETRFVSGDHDGERISPTVSCFEQDALINKDGLHNVVNRLSNWVVAVTFGGFVILRRDDLALWAATGSVSNFVLSITLKRILKQERPGSEVIRSGPGMPSSHAQTIFFTLVFMIMSVVKGMGLNGVTTILGIFLVALGSYFSWLRILLGYHTTNQVIVGTIVGSKFAILWFWVWEAIVCKVYNSNPWVQILLSVGGTCYYLGFISFVLWHLIKD